MLLDAVILTLLVSLLAGGRPGRLKDIELRGVGIFVAAAVVRVALEVLGAKASPAARVVGPWLSGAAYVGLLVALWLNRHLWPLRLVALGIFLNFLVIAANGGSMPVDRDLARRYADPRLVRMLDSPDYVVHKPVTAQTRLKPFADILPLPMLVPRPTWFSPGSVGDILITFGACALLVTGLGAFGTARRAVPAATGARVG